MIYITFKFVIKSQRQPREAGSPGGEADVSHLEFGPVVKLEFLQEGDKQTEAFHGVSY